MLVYYIPNLKTENNKIDYLQIKLENASCYWTVVYTLFYSIEIERMTAYDDLRIINNISNVHNHETNTSYCSIRFHSSSLF